MIKTFTLFRIPLLSMFTLLIPLIGIPIFIFIVLFWTIRRWDDIGEWLYGHVYKQGEYDKNNVEDWK